MNGHLRQYIKMYAVHKINEPPTEDFKWRKKLDETAIKFNCIEIAINQVIPTRIAIYSAASNINICLLYNWICSSVCFLRLKFSRCLTA